MSASTVELHHRRGIWSRAYERLEEARIRGEARRRRGRPAVRRVAGLTLVVLPGVFDPVLCRTGKFLAEHVRAYPVSGARRILDLGTGTGASALAAAAASPAAEVVAIDVDPRAVRCARANAVVNALERRVEVREGDLFAPVHGERFDLVVSNPPFLPGVPRSPADLAFRAGDVAERLAGGLDGHLAPGGMLVLVLSSVGEVDPFVAALRGHGFAVTLRHRRRFVNETLGIVSARRKGEDAS